MNLIGIAILISISFISLKISELIHFPSLIIGIFILYFALETKVIKKKYIESTSEFLQKNMSVLFVPLTVGVFLEYNVFSLISLKILIIIIISTFFSYIIAYKIAKKGLK